MRTLVRVALILAVAALLAVTAPAVEPFDAEHWLAEMEMVCASLERGGECAP